MCFAHCIWSIAAKWNLYLSKLGLNNLQMFLFPLSGISELRKIVKKFRQQFQETWRKRIGIHGELWTHFGAGSLMLAMETILFQNFTTCL